MSLFQIGNFKAHSGASLLWKVECDALTNADWDALALMAVERLPRFRHVYGVPSGGLLFAKALEDYRDMSSDAILIADDVLITGFSMAQYADMVRPLLKPVIGVVAFARGDWPSWVTPIWALAGCKEKP